MGCFINSCQCQPMHPSLIHEGQSHVYQNRCLSVLQGQYTEMTLVYLLLWTMSAKAAFFAAPCLSTLMEGAFFTRTATPPFFTSGWHTQCHPLVVLRGHLVSATQTTCTPHLPYPLIKPSPPPVLGQPSCIGEQIPQHHSVSMVFLTTVTGTCDWLDGTLLSSFADPLHVICLQRGGSQRLGSISPIRAGCTR